MGHFAKSAESAQTKQARIYYEIEPHLPTIVDGETKYITMINLCSIYDNLIDTVEFTYTMYYSDFTKAITGKYVLDKESYSTWDATEDGAYKIVCEDLNLKIIKE